MGTDCLIHPWFESKERRNYTPTTDVFAWLINLINSSYLQVFHAQQTVFLNSWNFSRKLLVTAPRVIIVTLQVPFYLNCTLQRIFFFECSRNLEIIFVKNTSKNLLLQFFFQWKLKVFIQNHHSNFLRMLAKGLKSFLLVLKFDFLF